MTTYTVHPLVSDGVIKGAKVVEKPKTNIFNSSLDNHMKVHEAYDQALQQSIDSALSFENQEEVTEKLASAAPIFPKETFKLRDVLFDSLSWRVTEVEQYRCKLKGGLWAGWVENISEYEDNADIDSIHPRDTRTVLHIVEEKEEPAQPEALKESMFPLVTDEAKELVLSYLVQDIYHRCTLCGLILINKTYCTISPTAPPLLCHSCYLKNGGQI